MDNIKSLIHEILNEKPILMDSFDKTYLEDFHHILRENFGITNISDPKLHDLVELLNLSEENNIKDLTKSLLQKLNKDDFSPEHSTLEMKQRQGYTGVDGWKSMENVTVDGNLETVRNFLINYSINSGGKSDISQEQFIQNWGRSDEWRNKVEAIIFNYIDNNEDVSMLTIGPRWNAEVTFLRNKFNIDVIGLDLFSYDESLVVCGDMHDMDFKNDTFDIVYEKNTYNKAYDIRKALDESVRVLKPGGLLIYDECMDYTCGVNENARTNIKSHEWTVSYLRDKIEKVLLSDEMSSPASSKWWMNKVGIFVAKIK
jgi:hypothetical protein